MVRLYKEFELKFELKSKHKKDRKFSDVKKGTKYGQTVYKVDGHEIFKKGDFFVWDNKRYGNLAQAIADIMGFDVNKVPIHETLNPRENTRYKLYLDEESVGTVKKVNGRFFVEGHGQARGLSDSMSIMRNIKLLVAEYLTNLSKT